MRNAFTIAVILLAVATVPVFANAQGARIYIKYDTSLHKESLTGRLFVLTQKDTSQEVNLMPDPFSATPMFAKNVTGWKQEQVQVIDSTADGYPLKMNKLDTGYYRITALMDINNEEHNFSISPGNIVCKKSVIIHITSRNIAEATLFINGTFKERAFKETASLKEVKLKSNLLSAFRKKDIFIQAAVILPPSYETEPAKNYPVVYIIPGWGGTHYDAQNNYAGDRYGFNKTGVEKIYVYLNPETQTPFGLHAFVDSRVNGPWGKALAEELVPYIDEHYQTTKNPAQRFIIGQSTGGYGALWNQLNYPNVYGGCWAVSPDPVDFHHFIGINLYAKNANFYTDKNGKEMDFFILEGKPQSTIRKYTSYETFVGDGEQLQSFEAEFGVPDKNGRPKQLFNRTTGVIDPKRVKEWAAYDLTAFIEKNWKKIGPMLKDKVHVYAGKDDNFYLNDAVQGFGDKAKNIGASVMAELFPNSNHWSIWKPEFTLRVQNEMDALIKASPSN